MFGCCFLATWYCMTKESFKLVAFMLLLVLKLIIYCNTRFGIFIRVPLNYYSCLGVYFFGATSSRSGDIEIAVGKAQRSQVNTDAFESLALWLDDGHCVTRSHPELKAVELEKQLCIEKWELMASQIGVCDICFDRSLMGRMEYVTGLSHPIWSTRCGLLNYIVVGYNVQLFILSGCRDQNTMMETPLWVLAYAVACQTAQGCWAAQQDSATPIAHWFVNKIQWASCSGNCGELMEHSANMLDLFPLDPFYVHQLWFLNAGCKLAQCS